MRFIDVDPTLSEFTQEEMTDVAVAISMWIEEQEKHIAALRKYEVLSSMYASDIKNTEARIERLQTVYTQLINAHARKEFLRRAANN